MKKVFNIIYIIATAIVAIVITILKTQPALFFIDFLGLHIGEKFTWQLVFFLTWLVLLSPFVIISIVLFYTRKAKNQTIEAWQTGIIIKRKKQLQSGLVGINIYVNNQKNGVVDIGLDKFIETPTGKVTIVAGEGKEASESIELEIKAGQKINLKLEIVSKGLALKNVLMLNDII